MDKGEVILKVLILDTKYITNGKRNKIIQNRQPPG